MTNSTPTTSIGSGEVQLDSLIEALTDIHDNALRQVEDFTSADNAEFKAMISNASESIAKSVAERVVLRNSVKRDIARRLAEELTGNTSFMDELGRQIMDIHARQSQED
jgi:isochorismate synthase EntC